MLKILRFNISMTQQSSAFYSLQLRKILAWKQKKTLTKYKAVVSPGCGAAESIMHLLELVRMRRYYRHTSRPKRKWPRFIGKLIREIQMMTSDF